MSDPTAVLRRVVASTRPTGLVMDFDGVLSPITDDPPASCLIDGAEAALKALSGRLDLVALLSGRPVEFLAERVDVPGLVLLGSYGLERRTPAGREVLPEVERWLPGVDEAHRQLVERFNDFPGAYVERKSIAVAVHWRRATDQAAAGRAVSTAIAQLATQTGLHAEPGKLVWELRPPVPMDKGIALRGLVTERDLATVLYAGDDRGDLPAFAAVRALGGYSLIVRGAGMDAEVAAQAGTHFDGPASFVGWLTDLADALDE